MNALGIDLGTTKVAVVIYNKEKGLIAAESSAHQAAIINDDPACFEQDPEKITDCVKSLLAKLPQELLKSIAAVGITGQMHSLLTISSGGISPLVTWQDHRCGEALINKFNSCSGLQLREGFGGTTLARMAADGSLESDMRAATISDYLVSHLTGADRFITDPTHAASWGIYDIKNNCWNGEALAALNIPLEILPEIHPCGAVAGRVSDEAAQQFNLPANAAVINAIGDNQASILGTGDDFDTEIYLTLGTGAQLSLVTENITAPLPENIELRPFPGNRQLLVSAPLCGGSSFAFLADAINTFRTELGEEVIDRGRLLDKLDDLAMQYLAKHGTPEITVEPHFLGERYAPELRGSINGLTLNNVSAGALAAALATGTIRCLKQNFPQQELSRCKTVVGSGNAVRLVKCLQYAITSEFGLPLKQSASQEEAACGAAKQALNSVMTQI